MSLSILAAAALLATASPSPDSRGDRAFEAAKRRELHELPPELVLLIERPDGRSWETVSVYRMYGSPGRAGTGLSWVIRRDRWGDMSRDEAEGEDQYESIGNRVLTTWAHSGACAGIIPLLEAVERIPPTPYDLRDIGSDYDGDVIVGVARSRFWLTWGFQTPAIETRSDLGALRWWGDAALEPSCWTTRAPVAG